MRFHREETDRTSVADFLLSELLPQVANGCAARFRASVVR